MTILSIKGGTDVKFTFKNLLYLFFPKKCPFCKKVIDSKSAICSTCSQKINKDIAVRKILIEDLNKEIICIAPFSYKAKIKDAICDYKFHGKLDYAEFFSQEIIDTVIPYFPRIDCITSVPLYKKRKRERGFNQAEVLSKKIANLMNVSYKEILVKSKNNKVQHRLSKVQRVQNVKGVYSVIDKNYIKGKIILLCDDIITTGNTLKECAKTLFDYGAKAVYCVTIASANLKN